MTEPQGDAPEGVRSDAEVRATLAMLSQAPTEDAALALLAQMRGDKMIELRDLRGDMHMIKVDRVETVGSHYAGGTYLRFNGLPLGHPKAELIVEKDLHKVVNLLRENGWKH